MSPSATAGATPLYDTAALRTLEARATAVLGGDDYVLMQRAGQAAWRFLLQHWPQAERIVVACGPGNNGGDGYVLARHARESGRDVRVLRLPAHAPRSALAQRACADYGAAGGRIDTFADDVPDCDLIVDALFGIGFSRAPDAETARLFVAIDRAGAEVFSLDVPSGIDVERASAPGDAVHAERTLQFIARHAGLHTGTALDHAGKPALATLDVDPQAFVDVALAAELLQAEQLRSVFRPRLRNAHKGHSGHVLCIGGDAGHGGAAMLCAEAALRAGAGLVSLATRSVHVPAMLAQRAEVMAHGVEAADALRPLLDAASVIALGPGLGQGEWGSTLLDAALASGKPCVLDADALNLLAKESRALPADAVLTPHPGEAARLLGSSAAKVQGDRFAAVRALCECHRCVVVLKGAGTLVAAPGAIVRVIGAGNPGMAVGGMGDVLTGVIAALRAQNFDAFDAASFGALLHAAAGDAAARDGGERGLLPSDLFVALRRLVNP